MPTQLCHLSSADTMAYASLSLASHPFNCHDVSFRVMKATGLVVPGLSIPSTVSTLPSTDCYRGAPIARPEASTLNTNGMSALTVWSSKASQRALLVASNERSALSDHTTLSCEPFFPHSYPPLTGLAKELRFPHTP